MSLSYKLTLAAENLMRAEEEVVSIATSIEDITRANATTIAGLKEMLEQAKGDLDEAQAEAVEVAALFAGEMAVQRAEKRRAS